MKTCRDIITRALTRCAVVGLGEEATAEEAESGMEILQSFYDGLFQGAFFGAWTDIHADADYEANEFERINANGFTITLPTEIEDFKFDNNVRSPKDLAAVQIINNNSRENYIFEGDWILASNLTLNDDAPFSERDSNGLASLIASYYAETFGTQVGPMTAELGRSFKSSLMRFDNIVHDSALTRKNRYFFYA